MTARERAVEADVSGDIRLAIDLYEELVVSAEATIRDYVNLAFLYWQCTEFGFASAMKLDEDFIARSEQRHVDMLGEAEERFGPNPEVQFWRRYLAWAYLGEPDFTVEAKRMLAEGVTAAAFYLFTVSDGKECRDEALDILEAARSVPTHMSKYVASIIESTLAQSGD
jgi:hypothetical protein